MEQQHRAKRIHDFSYGHRVSGHESKCAHLHGHNGRITFYVQGDLDDIGRVMDFGEIGRRLCNWLEENWDHRMLIWTADPWLRELQVIDPEGIQIVAFNPTAENMAEYLVTVVGPLVLSDTGVTLVCCEVEETRKCSATYELKK